MNAMILRQLTRLEANQAPLEPAVLPEPVPRGDEIHIWVSAWAGDIAEEPPEKLDAIINTTPVWRPVVEALKNLAPGGRLGISAIRKEAVDQDELRRLDYPAHLWMEKEIRSVPNLTRANVVELLALAADAGIVPECRNFRWQRPTGHCSSLKPAGSAAQRCCESNESGKFPLDKPKTPATIRQSSLLYIV